MAYDEGVAQRVREALQGHSGITERKMFGGLAFMVHEHMFVGVQGDTLMIRVGPEAYEAALREPFARVMDFTGRPMKGYVYVAAEGFEADTDLASWVSRSHRFAATLPPKPRR